MQLATEPNIFVPTEHVANNEYRLIGMLLEENFDDESRTTTMHVSELENPAGSLAAAINAHLFTEATGTDPIEILEVKGAYDAASGSFALDSVTGATPTVEYVLLHVVTDTNLYNMDDYYKVTAAMDDALYTASEANGLGLNPWVLEGCVYLAVQHETRRWL